MVGMMTMMLRAGWERKVHQMGNGRLALPTRCRFHGGLDGEIVVSVYVNTQAIVVRPPALSITYSFSKNILIDQIWPPMPLMLILPGLNILWS
jgi:hypothetical protein